MAAGSEFNSPQMNKIVQALTAQAEMMVTMMTKMEAMALASKGPLPVPQCQQVANLAHSYTCSEVVGQPQKNCQGGYQSSADHYPASCEEGHT